MMCVLALAAGALIALAAAGGSERPLSSTRGSWLALERSRSSLPTTRGWEDGA
jgi:hypothetical protein